MTLVGKRLRASGLVVLSLRVSQNVNFYDLDAQIRDPFPGAGLAILQFFLDNLKEDYESLTVLVYCFWNMALESAGNILSPEN